MTIYTRLLIGVITALLIFGLAILGSAQVFESQRRTDQNYFFLKQQLISILAGLVGFFIGYGFDYKFWKKHAVAVFAITILLLILVFIPRLGVSIRGAKRWVDIGGFSFQPAELAKLGVVIYFSAWLSSKEEKLNNFSSGFVPFLFFFGVLALLFVLQPDVGTLVLLTGISFLMFFLAGADVKFIILFVLVGVVAFLVMIAQAPYRLERIEAFLNPNKELLDSSYQLHQSVTALGAGGLLGRGYAQSIQNRLGLLPEAITDSIFSVLGEELGFIGAVGFIIMIFVFFFLGLQVAKRAPDKFGALLSGGITIWITAQALFNIGAILGLLPLTGLPLPFVSQGGSAMVAVLTGCGILLNVSKHAEA